MPTHLPPSKNLPQHLRLAAYLSSIEIGLGGLCHTFKIPLAGYFLSLHQIFCLSRAMRERDKEDIFSPIKISFIAGILKVLSPIGKRFPPFVAITIQGFLFNLGIWILGPNLIGHCIGATLASIWGFIQPLLIAGLVFGSHMTEGFKLMNDFCLTLAPWLNCYVIVLFCVLFKALLSIIITCFSYQLSQEKWSDYQNLIYKNSKIQTWVPQPSFQKKTFLKKIFSFWVLFPLFLSCMGFIATEGISKHLISTTSWSLALYFLLILVLSLINMDFLVRFLQKYGGRRISRRLIQAIHLLKQQGEKL